MEFPETRAMLANLGGENEESRKNMSCIAKNCLRMLSDYNCSCTRNMTNTTCIDKSPEADPIIPVILLSISALFLLIFIIELVVISINKKGFLDNFCGTLLFFMGIVSSIVTQLCTMQYLVEESDNVTVWYNIVLGVVMIFVIILGYDFAFSSPVEDNIGSHDKGMGLVLGVITLFLFGLEIMLVCKTFVRKIFGTAIHCYLLVYTCEKIVQVLIYIAIRRRKAKVKRGAVFYFQFLAYINFTLWLNTMPFADIQILSEVSHRSYQKYVDTAYKALLVDYRLLYALLYFEHSINIKEEQPQNPDVQNQTVQNRTVQIQYKNRFTGIGLLIGLCCLALEALCAAQHGSSFLSSYVNICPILADIILVVLGCCLMKSVKGSLFSHNEKVNVVFLMVSAMGAISIIYLLSFALLSFTSLYKYVDVRDEYVRWVGFVNVFRGASLFILLHVYTAIPMHTIRVDSIPRNFILVSALFSGLFARFIGSILDEFDMGKMHEIAHHHLEEKKLRYVQDLFELGQLFHVATSLHLALHFLVMLWHLHERPVDLQVNGDGAGGGGGASAAAEGGGGGAAAAEGGGGGGGGAAAAAAAAEGGGGGAAAAEGGEGGDSGAEGGGNDDGDAVQVQQRPPSPSFGHTPDEKTPLLAVKT